MFAAITITPWHWVAFIAFILVFLALDLGVFHRQAHEVRFKEALMWSSIFFVLSMLFASAIFLLGERQSGVEFLTGYLIELSLSMDNVFVIALIFGYFRVPSRYQHRVLFWGILGALVMRGVLIGAGAVIVARFHWTLYVFGAFLIYSGIKMCFASDEGVHPEKNVVLRLARRVYPVTHEYDGQKFTTLSQGQRALTPLALVLLMVETTDLIFALDSIPAIFAVTQDPFIIFTSNAFAILGLRSLYFVLAGAIQYFRYLKFGLSIVLVVIGVKMLLEIWHIKLSTTISLGAVAGIILASIGASLLAARKERLTHPANPEA